MKFFTALLITTAAAASTACKPDECPKGDLNCYVRCFNLPNPTPIQAEETNLCNAQCFIDNNANDECFMSCIRDIFMNHGFKDPNQPKTPKENPEPEVKPKTEPKSDGKAEVKPKGETDPKDGNNPKPENEPKQGPKQEPRPKNDGPNNIVDLNSNGARSSAGIAALTGALLSMIAM